MLLTIGDPTALPVPASSSLPANILHLDLLSLEYHLLRRAQENGVPGTPDRQQSLTSLGALLQILHIPSPPFAPVSNAGNEAFYTLLAFQKLMMAESRLPDLLFSQPSVTGYPGSFPGFPGYPSMSHLQHPTMPPVLPFARPEHSRAGSGSSFRHSDYFLPVQVELPQQLRRASEYTRPRPVSMDDNASPNPDDPLLRRPATPEALRQPGSAPPTARSERRSLPRSQTAYWEHEATAETGLNEYFTSARTHQGKPRESVDSGDTKRGRMPPSALRTASGGTSSRNISWEAEKTRDSLRASSTVSTPLKDSRSRPQLRDMSSSSLNKEILGSSTKESSVSDGKSSREGKGKGSAEKEGKGKAKSEKTVKDIAGAFAKFWVG